MFGRAASGPLPATKTNAAEWSSDLLFIRRRANGDKVAMHALFAKYRTQVYRWLLRFVGNEAQAEDILSEVLLEVWRQADRFEARSSVSTWMLIHRPLQSALRTSPPARGGAGRDDRSDARGPLR